MVSEVEICKENCGGGSHCSSDELLKVGVPELKDIPSHDQT
jgi:hypothetical protein